VERGQLIANWNGNQLKIGISGDLSLGDSILVGVRPEEIRILRTNENQLSDNVLSGVISRDLPRGADHMLEVALEGGSFEVRVTHPDFVDMGLAVGQTRYFVIRPDAFHIFMS
jgi:hypothetical protein